MDRFVQYYVMQLICSIQCSANVYSFLKYYVSFLTLDYNHGMVLDLLIIDNWIFIWVLSTCISIYIEYVFMLWWWRVVNNLIFTVMWLIFVTIINRSHHYEVLLYQHVWYFCFVHNCDYKWISIMQWLCHFNLLYVKIYLNKIAGQVIFVWIIFVLYVYI